MGDLNRDGRGDVVIGAPYYNQPPPIIGLPDMVDAGRITVRLGTATGLSNQVSGAAGDVDNALFGASVSAAGDYELYCPVDGHRDRGMERDLAVGGGGTTTGETTTEDDEDSGYRY